MLTTVNPAGFLFVWPNGSDFVEVYHDNADHHEVPIAVLWAGDLRYSEGSLRKLANESPEFAKSY